MSDEKTKWVPLNDSPGGKIIGECEVAILVDGTEVVTGRTRITDPEILKRLSSCTIPSLGLKKPEAEPSSYSQRVLDHIGDSAVRGFKIGMGINPDDETK